MVTPTTCQSCKHWVRYGDINKYDYPNFTPEDHSNVTGVEPDDSDAEKEYRAWDAMAPLWGTCNRQHAPQPPMFTNDGSGYFSALRTLETFHCAAWELSDVQPSPDPEG